MVKIEYRFGTRVAAVCGIPICPLLIWCLEQIKNASDGPSITNGYVLTPDLQAIVTLIQIGIGAIFAFCGWVIYRWIRPKIIQISN
jgi:hypothetical protein